MFHRDKIITGREDIYKYNFVWHFVFKSYQIKWRQFKEGKQIVNHIRNIKLLTDKDHMSRLLRKFDETKKYIY